MRRADERAEETGQHAHLLALGPSGGDGDQLLEVAQNALIGPPRSVVGSTRRGAFRVEFGQPSSHGGDVGLAQLTAPEQGRDRLVFVVAAHLDHVIDGARVIFGAQLDALWRAHGRPDAAVDIGGEAAVEADLGGTQIAPALRRPVVQERQYQRLFQLVGRLLSDQHPRDVCLADVDRSTPGALEEAAQLVRLQRRGVHAIPRSWACTPPGPF